MDKSSVEKVYNLLELKDDVAFAHLVKEALDVIEMGLDKYGWVRDAFVADSKVIDDRAWGKGRWCFN